MQTTQIAGDDRGDRIDIGQIEEGDQPLLARPTRFERRRMEHPGPDPGRSPEPPLVTSGIELARKLGHAVLDDHRCGSDPEPLLVRREELGAGHAARSALGAAGIQDPAPRGKLHRPTRGFDRFEQREECEGGSEEKERAAADLAAAQPTQETLDVEFPLADEEVVFTRRCPVPGEMVGHEGERGPGGLAPDRDEKGHW